MISAKIIADSQNIYGGRITTWELEYPRFIHSEFMTHRVFSRNSASSRAIPIERMIQTIEENPAMPIHWGKNQAGMQAKEELDPINIGGAKEMWRLAMVHACFYSQNLHRLGVHKQIANRVTEPFQHMKVVMTTTEHNNWFWLRDHSDAQPEIGGVEGGLAKLMKEAYDLSTPVVLQEGMWHLPYVKCVYDSTDQFYRDENEMSISLEQALMISASCCAQVSYRKSDSSLEKAETIYDRLINSEPCHASPIEHQARAIGPSFDNNVLWIPGTWPKGITHIDRDGNLWSGNFRNWIQYRQLIPNNVKRG